MPPTTPERVVRTGPTTLGVVKGEAYTVLIRTEHYLVLVGFPSVLFSPSHFKESVCHSK